MFEGLFKASKTTAILPREVKAKLDAKEKFLLFDVRSPEEYAGGHIEHSINLPVQDIRTHTAKYTRSKDMEIVVYCLSGARSSRALGMLEQMGYTNVRNLGGISSWPYGSVR